MPQLVAFNRKWAIGSDDFVFPGFGEIILRLIWLIIVSVIFHVHKDSFDCEGGHLLHVYYIGLLSLLSISIVMTGVVVYTSMRGTITNTTSRRKLAKFIYVKVAISLPELAWNIMGTVWAFGDSSGCEKHVIFTVKGVVLTGWVIGIIAIIGIAVVFDPLGALHPSSHQTVVGEDQMIADAAQSAKQVWERRCKILCCCVGCDEQSHNAFSGIAEIISNFFQGVDLVPTDIACGLILVHRHQKIQKYRLTNVRVDSDTDPSAGHACNGSGASGSCPPSGAAGLPTPKEWMSVPMMQHYMKFAMASYGWPLYIFTHLVTGTCQLWSQCKCCSCMRMTTDIADDNCCLCNTASIRKTTGVHQDDIIYASFHNRIYEIPFFVSIDRERNAVVIAVRGTLSLKDVITDLTAECDSLEIEGLEDCVAHRGMLQAAKYVQSTLDRLQLLEKAFDKAQGARLVVTGHSLGAGTAALLAILLKPRYPDLICFSFSPPGGLMSECASKYCQEFVCSVVLGKDFIPRLGIHTMEGLKTQLLQGIQKCDVPKYQLLASGAWQMLCGFKPPVEESEESEVHTPLVNGNERLPSYTNQQHNIQVALQEAERHREQCRITHTQMFPPGQILQIKETHRNKRCFSTPDYTSEWAGLDSYSEVIVSPKMFSDHFPDAVMRALDQLAEKDHTPMLRPIGGVVNV